MHCDRHYGTQLIQRWEAFAYSLSQPLAPIPNLQVVNQHLSGQGLLASTSSQISHREAVLSRASVLYDVDAFVQLRAKPCLDPTTNAWLVGSIANSAVNAVIQNQQRMPRTAAIHIAMRYRRTSFTIVFLITPSIWLSRRMAAARGLIQYPEIAVGHHQSDAMTLSGRCDVLDILAVRHRNRRSPFR
jgi:hypothetical protein